MVSFKSILAISAAAASTALAAPRARGTGCGTVTTPEFLEAARIMSTMEATARINGNLSAMATIEVDVYFHVVALDTTEAGGYIPESQLTAQLDYMNEAYAPQSIHFNLVDTTRTVNPTWARDGNGAELTMKRALRQGTYSDLNLYFLPDMGSNLGYCYYPTSVSTGSTSFYRDGCTILSFSVPGGTETDYNLGGTVVHEVGHWFGLAHTFEGQSCTGAGDSVADTPQQLSPTSGCPSSRDSCPNQAGLDPIHNYMDYSTDICYEEFTAGQQTRMYSMWNAYRA